jgi:CheY-like chemotaxis protein
MPVPKSPNKIPYIVLADDDADECLLFKDALEHKQVPFMFSFVSDGKMLLNLLDEKNLRPDFIFIDLHSSELSSTACMEELKTRKGLQKVPVIVYSGSASPGDKDYCYNTKASEYFLTALDYLI